MCDIKGKYRGKTFTGYKGAYRDEEGVIRSLVSRIEYQLGPVPVVETDVVSIWNTNVISRFFDKDHVGKTGVFKHARDAEKWTENVENWVILKMTVSGDLLEGYTNPGGDYDDDDEGCDVIMGNNIDAMEVYLELES